MARSKFVKIKYEAIVELQEEVEGIPDDSPLMAPAKLLHHALLNASPLVGQKNHYKGLAKAVRFTVGLYHPAKPRNRKKKET